LDIVAMLQVLWYLLPQQFTPGAQTLEPVIYTFHFISIISKTDS
jgi:hypothetical protein